MSNAKKVTAIIQARITSTRLPGKVLMDIEKMPLLWHLINRLKFSKKIDEIILAIPDTEKNDKLEQFAQKYNLRYFRGSEGDVLSRYYGAAKKFKCGIILRITGDNPLYDPSLIDFAIEKHSFSGGDYTSTSIKKKFPEGVRVEVLNFKVLEMAYEKAREKSQREHVTPYIYQNFSNFKIVSIENNDDLSNLRWTVDEDDDLKFVREIYKHLYKKNKIFSGKNILDLLRKKPELSDINQKIKQIELHQEIEPAIFKNFMFSF
jgi:spore coat polysaccharide biosynthesis protein SpsF